MYKTKKITIQVDVMQESGEPADNKTFEDALLKHVAHHELLGTYNKPDGSFEGVKFSTDANPVVFDIEDEE